MTYSLFHFRLKEEKQRHKEEEKRKLEENRRQEAEEKVQDQSLWKTLLSVHA